MTNNFPDGYTEHEFGIDRTASEEALYEQARENVLSELNGKYVSDWELDRLIGDEMLSICDEYEEDYE